jgi:hypothetical protein
MIYMRRHAFIEVYRSQRHNDIDNVIETKPHRLTPPISADLVERTFPASIMALMTDNLQ